VQHGDDRWSFAGAIPPCLRNGYGKPETYNSKQDALDAAFWNGYDFIQEAALVSSYGASEWRS
jgi:hypothetical protein